MTTDSEKPFEALIDLQRQTHSCVKALQRDVTKNTAKTVANGVKLDGVIKNCDPCRAKMANMEIWKAIHTGEATGKVHRASRFSTKTKLICMIGGTLLALLGFWFSTIQPAINASSESLAQFKAINGQLSELNILK